MSIQKDFPQLDRGVVYLDSAASSLTPEPVLVAMENYYRGYRANVHRGVYEWSTRATTEFEFARGKVADFLGCGSDCVVVTRGATDGLNLVAELLDQVVTEGQNIVVPISEHHSNLLPWRELAQRKGLEVRYVELVEEAVTAEAICEKIDEKTALVAVAHISNVLGGVVDVSMVADCAHRVGALVVVDGCQAVAHIPVNVRELRVDWHVFSGHKVYGPTGVGVVYGSREVWGRFRPMRTGGDMIRRVSRDGYEPAPLPYCFEPGTPPIAEMIGLGVAVSWVSSLGWNWIVEHESVLLDRLQVGLLQNSEVRILGPSERRGLVSLIYDGLDSLDVALLLGSKGICVRSGFHCAEPLAESLGIVGSTRISFGVYNTERDVEVVVRELKHIKRN